MNTRNMNAIINGSVLGISDINYTCMKTNTMNAT